MAALLAPPVGLDEALESLEFDRRNAAHWRFYLTNLRGGYGRIESEGRGDVSHWLIFRLRVG
jgi:hypothetical protein